MTLTLTLDLINKKASVEHIPYTKSARITKYSVWMISGYARGLFPTIHRSLTLLFRHNIALGAFVTLLWPCSCSCCIKQYVLRSGYYFLFAHLWKQWTYIYLYSNYCTCLIILALQKVRFIIIIIIIMMIIIIVIKALFNERPHFDNVNLPWGPQIQLNRITNLSNNILGSCIQYQFNGTAFDQYVCCT